VLFSQIGQAAGLFAITNVDDLVILALFSAQARGQRHGLARVVLGQYLGFGAIVALAAAGALGVRLLPGAVVPYIGLLPLLLGLRAALRTWRARRGADGPDDDGAGSPQTVGIVPVAAVTFANGGDNIALYMPVFAIVGDAGLVLYVVTFLALVGVWCAAALLLATRPRTAHVLARWGHVLLPVVLIALGLIILIEGGAVV
jgi:cadmium resistance protein CadD (predicted permease)